MTDPAVDTTTLAARRADGATLLLALPAYLLIAAAWPLVSAKLVPAAFDGAQATFNNLMLFLGCATIAIPVAGMLSPRRRRTALGISLAVGAFVLATAPLLVQADTSKPQLLALIFLTVIGAARALAAVLAVVIALDGFRGIGAAKPAAAVGAAAAAATLAWAIADFIARKINPDLGALLAAGQIIALAGGVIAVVLIAQLAGSFGDIPGDDAKPQGWTAAFADLWRTPAVRLAMAGRIVALCAIAGLRVSSYELSLAKGSTGPEVFTRGAGFTAAFAIAGTLAGALLADRRRGRDAGADAMVCAIALAAAVPVYLFGIYATSPMQLAVSFGLAAGLCLAAWAPTFMIVQDPAKPAANAVAVGALVWLSAQLDLFGLPHLIQALALRLAGAEIWTFNTGFWGELKFGSFTTRFFLPFKLQATLGASGSGVVQSAATLACLILAVAAGLYFLSAKARRAEATAPPPETDATGPILARMLTTFGIAAIVVVGAICIQAMGAFERQWSDKVVWKAPDLAWAAVRQCKTTDCLTDLMARNGAAPEAIAFTNDMHQRLGGDYVGYATGFHGDGRVKAVETLLPNLSTAGYVGLVFLDGTRPLVSQYESAALDRIAGTNDVFQRIHVNYPMSTTWPEHSFAREETRAGGGQSFVMDLRIVNGCKTCSALGSVQVAYDFDGRGHFEGVRLLEVKSAPAPTPLPTLTPPSTTAPGFLPPPTAAFPPNRG